MTLVGVIALPIVAFIISVSNYGNSTHFMWNCVAFANHVFMMCVSMPCTVYLSKIMLNKIGRDHLWKEMEPKEVFWTDPEQSMACRADLYQFTWTICLKEPFLHELLSNSGQYNLFRFPNQRMKQQIFVMNFFSATTQISISSFIIYQLSTQDSVDYEIQWYVSMTRFIACVALHFCLQDEIWSAMRLTKYVAINNEKFERPWMAFFSTLTQFLSTLLIEIVLIYKLVTLENVIDIIMNFLALSVLATFDDMFVLPFIQTRYRLFAGMTIPFRDYKKSQYIIKDKVIMTKDLFD